MTDNKTHNGLVTIVIPNINGIEHLQVCMQSISVQTYNNFRVIVVDNGSKDRSVEFLRTEYPETDLILFDHNTGFAKAVNAGIKHAIGKFNSEFILLLNNDIELKENFLQAAVDTFKKIERADSLAVKMMNFYNRDIIDDTGNFLTKKGGTAYPRGNNQADKGQFDNPEYIFGACAGAAFYRSSIFENAGLFDEKFFAYLEDIDLSFRMQLAGFKCYYLPDAVCFHKRGGSSVSTIKFQAYMNERNIVWVRLKNYPLIMYIKYQPRFFLSRLKRFAALFKDHGFSVFLAALNGYIAGVFSAPLMLNKRSIIQRSKKVSSDYIYSLFR